MSTKWTTEQVLALAPDPSSGKSGRDLAVSRKWSALGSNSIAIWGACQGSGKNPYRTQIDLSEPAFRCSCPSRKFPCKHGLGLFLLLVEQPELFQQSGSSEQEPPDWVTEWLSSRSQRAEKQAEKRTKQTTDPAAQAKRVAERQRKISAGVQELRLWLEDRVRQGLATVPQESYQIWDAIAARMVDAQAPGLARHLRDCAGIAYTGAGWIDRLLAQLGRLYLLTEGFLQIESPPATGLPATGLLAAIQSDIQTQIGLTTSQETVVAGVTAHDLWLVVGQRTEEEDRLKMRRTWLLGLSGHQPALLLDFVYGNQSFEQSFLPGTCLEAEVGFYPSHYPLRALVKTRYETVSLSKNPPGYPTISEAIATYSQALVACPWLERFPLLLQAVVPVLEQERWLVQDSQGTVLPLSARLESMHGWQLLALSGGHPLTLFGEWNGTELTLLSVWMEDLFYGFGSE
jgi:hypothetical protein